MVRFAFYGAGVHGRSAGPGGVAELAAGPGACVDRTTRHDRDGVLRYRTVPVNPVETPPQAASLLTALQSRDRGFDAVVIGEPQRAFYGNQYGLTFPVFVHYGVQLWVPEVGGAIDPESEAHELVISVFGGMSKGERNRIKIRVRSAMAAQAQVEGRYLGGRPPHGYRLAAAGPHQHPTLVP